jgi:single-strand DNA-binding protein
MSYQICIIQGNLGRDPESRQTTGGTAVTEFSVAVNGYRKDDPPEWFRVVCFGKTAESSQKHLSKGRPVLVQGKIRTRKWEGKDGTKKMSVELVADSVQFLGGGKGDRQEQVPADLPGSGPFGDSEIPF